MKTDNYPSFPNPNDKYSKEDKREWESLKHRRPFSRDKNGTDYIKDQLFDDDLGGFTGLRIAEGFKMLEDDEFEEKETL